MADGSRKWHRLVRVSFFLAAALLPAVLGTIRYFANRATEEAKPGTTPAPSATLLPSPTVFPSIPANTTTPEASSSPIPISTITPPTDSAVSLPYQLIIPVADVRPEQLQDTVTDARSEGRRHDAIDIIAPRGAPVRAAVDGKIARLFNSEKGGITLYQLSPDQQFVFYYAHLDRYANGVKDGNSVKQGEVIAYVGDTGNAVPGNTHLHFAIWRISDPKKFWDGENINPFPLLRNSK